MHTAIPQLLKLHLYSWAQAGCRTLECKFIPRLILAWSIVLFVHAQEDYHNSQQAYSLCANKHSSASNILAFSIFVGRMLPILVFLSSSVCKLVRLCLDVISQSIIVIQIRYYVLAWWVLLRTFGNNVHSQHLLSYSELSHMLIHCHITRQKQCVILLICQR